MSTETDEQIAREVEALLRGVTLATCRSCGHDDTLPQPFELSSQRRGHEYGFAECYVVRCRCTTYSPYSEPAKS